MRIKFGSLNKCRKKGLSAKRFQVYLKVRDNENLFIQGYKKKEKNF